MALALTPYDLSNQASLALIGKYLKRININRLVDPTFSVRSGIANSDILKIYLGLLCLGKNDFDAIEGQRKTAIAHLHDTRIGIGGAGSGFGLGSVALLGCGHFGQLFECGLDARFTRLGSAQLCRLCAPTGQAGSLWA